MTVATIQNRFATFSGRFSSAYNQAKVNAPSQDVLLLGVLLIIAQVLDGVLTSVGVSHFGMHVEGNLMIRYLMQIMGHNEALLVVKAFACAAVCVLCCLANAVPWLRRALIGVLFLYLTAAIIPWSYVILTKIV